MKKDEALKLALEVLVSCEMSRYGRDWVYPTTAHETAMKNVKEAITAIKEALVQPEPSCVACEGSPSGSNNPCAVCGLAQPVQPAPAQQEPVEHSVVASARVEAIAEFAKMRNLSLDDVQDWHTSPPQPEQKSLEHARFCAQH